jgi:hypothetical protein
MASRLHFIPAGNSQRGEKIMEIEKGIKLVKRAWKAVALVELVVAAGALLFIFSHYFSYSVFVSNLRHMALANAANSAQPQQPESSLHP